MRGSREVVRYVAALMMLCGLLAGSLTPAAAQELSEVTINLSSTDPSVASEMPEGSSWMVLADGEPVASGVFAAEHLSLPATITVESPVPYGEYMIVVDATPVFDPYEALVTIEEPVQTVSVPLTPYVAQPKQASLGLSIEGGIADDVSLTFAIDDAETGDSIVSDSGVYSLPDVIWTGELMPGDYWISVYPDGNYGAISELVTVDRRTPTATFDFTLVPTAPTLIPSTLSILVPEGGPDTVEMQIAIDDAATGENIWAEQGTWTLPDLVWAGELAPGVYWVSIYPTHDYAAISTQVTVPDDLEEVDFAFELQLIEPEPTETATATAEPTQTTTATPTQTATTSADKTPTATVTVLPSTGQGSGPASGGALAGLMLGGVSLLLAAASLHWRQRRTEA